MTKQQIARYTITTITTKDIELFKRSNEVRLSGVTHEAIYRRGIEEIEKDLKKESE